MTPFLPVPASVGGGLTPLKGARKLKPAVGPISSPQPKSRHQTRSPMTVGDKVSMLVKGENSPSKGKLNPSEQKQILENFLTGSGATNV